MSPLTVQSGERVRVTVPLSMCPLCGATGFGLAFDASATDEYQDMIVGGVERPCRKFIVVEPSPLCPCSDEVWVRV